MKYGYYWYRKPFLPGHRSDFNIGDPIQSFSAIHMYKTLGIVDDDIIPINRAQAFNTHVSDVILCMNGPTSIVNSYNYQYDILPPAPGILPLYISFYLRSGNIDAAIADNMKIYGPVGCRDEATMNNLLSQGIPAYVSGCLTLTLPRRKESPAQRKVFIVDAPDSVQKHIPPELLENAEFVSHRPGNLPDDPDKSQNRDIFMSDWQTTQYHQWGYDILKRYENEAALVITGRLHAAAPCMAMGIPTVLVCGDFDRRYDVIEDMMPLYTPDTFHRIDWTPKPIDLSIYKEKMTALFSSKLRELEERARTSRLQDSVSAHIRGKNKFPFDSGWINAIQSIDTRQPIGSFAIWGVILHTADKHNILSRALPGLRAAAVIDQYVDGKFEGIPISKPECIDSLPEDAVVFVVANAAHAYAKEFLAQRARRFVLAKEDAFEYYEPGKDPVQYPFYSAKG